MQVGYNHNIKHKGREYHIQTEDSGKVSTTITTLLYSEGSIISSRKTNYSKITAKEDYAERLKGLMKKQHRQMLVDLKNGSFDDPELADLVEPEDVKDAEDKTIEEAIAATGKKDSEGAVSEPPPVEGEGDFGENEDVDRNSSRFADEIINSFVNTLLSLTQKNVEINKESEELITLDKLSKRFDDNIIISQSKLGKDIEAECAFINDIKTASIIADIVLMGEGTPKEELTADDMDALKETMNQAFGSSVQQITDIFGLKTSYEPVKLSVVNAKEQKEPLSKLFEEDSVYAFNFSIKIENIITSKIYFYLTPGISGYLADYKEEAKTEAKETQIIKEQDAAVLKAEDEIEVFKQAVEIEGEKEERGLRNVELIEGIEVEVRVKLGETIMPLKKIIKLSPGTIIDLNKDVESLLELVVNNKPIAEGVLVVVSTNNFALRITNILDKASRIKKLGGVNDY
jgi:flagellar motor switch protein FliN/FliY